MECLHIELAKKGFCASNGKVKEFQMTTYAERREKMLNHTAYLKWHQQDDSNRASTQTYSTPPMSACIVPASSRWLKTRLSRQYHPTNFQQNTVQSTFKTASQTSLHKSIILVFWQQYYAVTQPIHYYHFEWFQCSIRLSSRLAMTPTILTSVTV